MSDLTPPPDEPMSDQTRARIRADLLAATQGGGRLRTHGWLVPGVAAAAVLLVAGVAGWAVQTGGDGGADGGPAGTGTPTVLGTFKPGAISSSVPPAEAGERAGTGSCEHEMENVLPGAERAASFPAGATYWVTSFWVKGQQFVLCDHRADRTTVHKPLPLTPAEDVATYRVSSVYPPPYSADRVIRVAGGVVPEGAMASDVSYAFPNGGTQHAITTTDDQGRTWWRMLYAYGDSGNEMNKPPIEVTVSYSGVQKRYTLDWGTDTCAQADHR